MKRNEALPSKYIAKEDCPIRGHVVRVVGEGIESRDTGRTEDKPVLYLQEEPRGLILNGTNWDMLVEITGAEDSDDWEGTYIELYNDPSVRFGNKKTGGVRIRAAEQKRRPKPDANEAPQADANPYEGADEEVPF